MINVTADFHSHILPGIDDGAKTVEDSINLLKLLQAQGVTDVCLTPHFYTNQISSKDFVIERNKAYETLKSALPSDMNIKLHLGAEVFITHYLFSELVDNNICIDGTEYMLCEFSYSDAYKDTVFDYLEKLITICTVTPIIAHIERYKWIMKDKKAREKLRSMGVLFQTNAVSFCHGKYRRKLMKLVENDEISFLGTDAHSERRNSPMFFSHAQEIIKQKISPEHLNKIQQKSMKILY